MFQELEIFPRSRIKSHYSNYELSWDRVTQKGHLPRNEHFRKPENIDALLASVFNQRDDFVNRLLKVEPVRLHLNCCDFDWSRHGCVIHPLIEKDGSGDRLRRAREVVARSPRPRSRRTIYGPSSCQWYLRYGTPRACTKMGRRLVIRDRIYLEEVKLHHRGGGHVLGQGASP